MIFPKEITKIIKTLQKDGFEAYAVGGCARDFLLDKKPNDWDVTTNGEPEKIQKLFPKNFYNNKFGTVTVQTNSKNEEMKNIEITTYRVDINYSNKRHPDEVKFTSSLEEDLARRDFTINAMALDENKKIIDPFDGKKDLKNKLIRAVGDADKRFNEDALRMLRAVRLAVQLNFKIEETTFNSIKKNCSLLKNISQERIRDEFIKMILADQPDKAIILLKETGMMNFVIPELIHGIGVAQNKHHTYTVFEHSVLALKHCKSKKLEVRIASLLHDIAKPAVKRGEGYNATFYNHDHLGAKFSKKFLKRLHFPNEFIDTVYTLIYNHMFYYDMGVVTEGAVRRMIKRVGKENLRDLIDLRVADRLGSGVPKAKPYRLRHLEYMLDKVQHDPISVKMLKLNGDHIIKELNIAPSPIIGAILDALLAEVIENPKLNTKKYLLKRADELTKMDLAKIRKLAKEKIDTKKEEEDKEIKDKHWVK
ncbi:CCA tRNA nucleotidyltransferase [Patescibacteria group bacterium]